MGIGNERDIEVPFLLDCIRGTRVLDVGTDRDDYYTSVLRSRGMEVVTCDPWDGAHADYPVHFLDLPDIGKFDTVLLVSSLEHFSPHEDNLIGCLDDIDVINKALGMLSPEGVILITLPFGKERIYDDGGKPDFIQWNEDRVRYVQDTCEIAVIREEVYYYVAEGWAMLERASWGICDDLEYRAHGARNAAAVYCGVWK
jgi:hypothetical protein